MSFIDELHRRNVTRVAVAYAVTAWLLIQIAETIFPLFGFDDTPARIVVIVLAIGFIPAIILAWIYQLTPDGLKKDSAVANDHAARSSTKTTDRIIMAVLALAVTFLAIDKFVLSPTANSAYGGDQSIAVLPFINRSELNSDAYFSDGIHDEILTRLARITDVRVISRRSVMRFRDSELTIPEIGAELSVGAILEGSVQRSGDSVSINVRLIDADNDEHLWAEIFDRELTADNLFAIQSEISIAIANQLRVELSPETLAYINSVPTENADAYDLYLQALAEQEAFSDIDEKFLKIKPILEQAISLDPDFLDAQVLLAETYGRLLWAGVDPDRVYEAKALELVTDIRRRWPDNVESRIALGHYYYTVERDYEKALREFDAVASALPNDVRLAHAQTGSLKRLGRFAEAMTHAERWVSLEPESSNAAAERMLVLRLSGHAEEALAAVEVGLQKFPDDEGWRYFDAYYRFMLLGDVEYYIQYGLDGREDGSWANQTTFLSFALFGKGDIESTLAHLADRSAGEYNWSHLFTDVDRALILRELDRPEEAQIAANRALNFAADWFSSDRPFPDNSRRQWYRIGAYAAAVAGDIAKVNEYRKLAAAEAPDEFMVERSSDVLEAITDALLGDAAAGWDRLSQHLGPHYLSSPLMATNSYYRLFFADLPAYQSFITSAIQ
ncbi:MAG: hypothetical protein AAF351_09420 [Pseudomonadota bacterium]